ncbi:glutamate receptor ionotropic, kainate 3-like [Babylonia areolata]|uniref:glutamate receptor ionotropic, kainate 3-like n=1 Tax=Babylonia areolata TaxID=304850 RepID=UPI003FD09E41
MKGALLFTSLVLLQCCCHGDASSSFTYNIKASVLGEAGEEREELYSTLGQLLMEQHLTLHQRQVCALHFNTITFNRSSGDDVYRSLQKARDNFSNQFIAAAIGPFIDVFTSTDYVILHQYHLLTSAAGQKVELMDQSKVVSILPEPTSMARAIADVIHRLDWDNVAFLSQDDFAPVLHLSKKIQVWPIRLPAHISSSEDPELQRNLIELRKAEKDKLILHSTRRDTVHHVLMAAKKLLLLHHSIDWFISYPDFEDVVEDGQLQGSLYGLQLLRYDKIPDNFTHLLSRHNLSRLDLGLAVDVVGLLQHVLLAASDSCYLRPSDNDVFVTATHFKQHLKDKSRTYSGALGEYVWGNDTNARTNYTMDILSYRAGERDTVGSVDFVNGDPVVDVQEDIPLTAVPDRIFTDPLTIVTKQTDPFIIFRDGRHTGFSYDLLQELAKKLKFDFVLDDVTGRPDDAGPLGGMVKNLIEGKALMAVGKLEVTAERESEISFSYTILSTQASLLIRKAKSTRNYFQFLDPFKTDLWMMILAFIAVAAIALFLISRYDPTQQTLEQRFDLKESAWYALNILLQGTTDYSPQTTSMRAIIAFFWFSVIILEAAYTANLAAYLTLQQMDSRVKTVDDLARQNSIKYGVANNSHLMNFFQSQDEDPFERMWAFMKINEETSLLEDKQEIVERVMTGRFAFIADGVTNEYYATQYCGIEAIDQNFGAKDFSLGFPPGAPYRDDVNRALLELKENGVLDDLRQKWWMEGQNCSEDDDTRSVSDQTTAELEIANMVGVFIVLAAFVLLAVLVDIAKRVYRHGHPKEEVTQETEPPEPANPEATAPPDWTADPLHTQFAFYA